MKAKIVIAGTLKPVIDPRAYEKFAKSLAATGKYAVHIIGSAPSRKPATAAITLHPLATRVKGSWQRLLLPWRILWLTLKIKPQVLIINTHELIFMAVLYKLITCHNPVYDIRENYYFNLRYQSHYPKGIKHLLAFYVRLKERLTAHFFSHFILAEQCYQKELKFSGNRYTVIENKFKPPAQPPANNPQDKITLLLSGTISKEYGAFAALRFFRQLPQEKYALTLIGHCPHPATLRQLQQATAQLQNINFRVSPTPIPQAEIYQQIGDKTIGLLPYEDNKSIRNKIPTKLYEYLGLGLPILISPNLKWQHRIEKYRAGMVIDFNKPVTTSQINRINTLKNNIYSTDIKEIMWKTEETKLLSLVNQLI